MNLNSFLGKTITTKTGKSVLIEDIYPKERLCGKTPSGEFVVVTPDFNEVDMTEENAKWKQEVSTQSSVETTTSDVSEQPKQSFLYVEETICGGNDAAGGGCGAPLGIRTLGPKAGEKFKLFYPDFFEHNDSEIEAQYVQARNEGYLRVRRAFVPCNSCRYRF